MTSGVAFQEKAGYMSGVEDQKAPRSVSWRCTPKSDVDGVAFQEKAGYMSGVRIRRHREACLGAAHRKVTSMAWPSRRRLVSCGLRWSRRHPGARLDAVSVGDGMVSLTCSSREVWRAMLS